MGMDIIQNLDQSESVLFTKSTVEIFVESANEVCMWKSVFKDFMKPNFDLMAWCDIIVM